MNTRFNPDALAVADWVRAFADKMHYAAVARELLLLGFASGAGGELIRSAFERCKLSEDTVRSAIKYIDGDQRPVQPHGIKYVYRIAEMEQPYVQGLQTLSMKQLFPYMTPNADQVFKMARNETIDDLVTAEDILYIFLREVGRSDDDRRVMQVLRKAAPDLTLDTIRSAMVESLDAKIAELEREYGSVIIVDKTTLTEPQQEIARLKRARRNFMYKGHLQEA